MSHGSLTAFTIVGTKPTRLPSRFNARENARISDADLKTRIVARAGKLVRRQYKNPFTSQERNTYMSVVRGIV